MTLTLLLLLVVQAPPEPPPGFVIDKNPFEDLIPKEQLSNGPHTLVISDGKGMTKMDYKSGPLCQKARDAVRLQTDSRLTNRNPNIIYGGPSVKAFCVPR